MWIKSLKIENFQSHKETVLNFHPNFNTIIGTGNSGKTAIVRALSFILFGQWSPSWVRHGAKFCRITLTTDSGIEVVREKGDKTNKYIITQNGTPQVYENFGVHVPEEVQKILGIFKVSVGDKEEINLNLSTQLEPLFLLSNPGAFKAKVIGKLSKAHYLDHALRELNKDKKKWTQEKTLIEKELESIDARLVSYTDIETKKAILDTINDDLVKIQQLQQKLEALKSLQKRIQTWKGSYDTQQQIATKLANVQQISIGALEQFVAKVKDLTKIKERIALWKTTHASLTTALGDIAQQKVAGVTNYGEILQRAKKCPTCFGDITHEAICKIQQEL